MSPLRPSRKLGRPRLHARFSLAAEASLPVTGDRHPLRREAARWMICGGVVSVAVLGLGAAAWLWPAALGLGEPAPPEIRIVEPHRLFRPGLRGPVSVLGELSVQGGTDPITQAGPRPGGPAQAAPQPRVTVEGESGTPVDPGLDALAAGAPSVAGTDSGGGSGPPGAVEMHAPAQIDPCFVLRRVVRPQYPAGVDEAVMRRAEVHVEVAFFVDAAGEVTGSYILQSDGGPLFDDAVLAAVNAWAFDPVDAPGCSPLGFWVRLPVVFHSPYRLGGVVPADSASTP